jgi:5-hydroxyisourate hydrolase
MITHVLDTTVGRPGAAIAVELERAEAGTWQQVGAGVTDDDGRLRTLTPAGAVAAGTYRLRFHTHPYFASRGQTAFFPVV